MKLKDAQANLAQHVVEYVRARERGMCCVVCRREFEIGETVTLVPGLYYHDPELPDGKPPFAAFMTFNCPEHAPEEYKDRFLIKMFGLGTFESG